MADLAIIKELLAAQQNAYKDATSLLFNSLNQRIDDQNNTIYELRRSLEHSQHDLSEAKDELEKCKKELSNQSKQINENVKLINDLNDQVSRLEDHSRKRNIRIEGIEEGQQENWQQTLKRVDKLLKEKMDLKEIEVEYAHRVNKADKGNPSRPRTIVARLKHDSDKNLTMKNSWKLKGSRIFINEDLSDQTIRKRQEKLPDLKAARESGKIAYFIKDKLIIKERIARKENNSQQLHNTPRNRVSSLVNVFSPHTPVTTSEIATLPVMTADQDPQEDLPSPIIVKRQSARLNK